MHYQVKSRKGILLFKKDDVVDAVSTMRRMDTPGTRVVRSDGVLLAVSVPLSGSYKVFAEAQRAERLPSPPPLRFPPPAGLDTDTP